MNALCSAILVVLVILPSQGDAYNILMFPLRGKSHVFAFAAMAEGLADRRHNVSFFVGNSLTMDGVFKNRTEITVVRYDDSVDGQTVDYDSYLDNMTRMVMENRADTSSSWNAMATHVNESCYIWAMQNDEILNEMATEQFDLAVIDGLFFFKCIYLVPHRLQVPWITYTDMIDPLMVRVPWLPSFVPSTVLPYTDAMTFSQRLVNFGSVLAFSLLVPLTSLDPPTEMVMKYQQYGSFSSLDDLMSRSLMWLYTKDHILDYPRPLMPNTVDVGGLTVKRSTENLPPEIKHFVTGAKKGVILVTFGSSVVSYPLTVAENFIAAFRELRDYRVLWRMKNRHSLEIPDNVMISGWLPQNGLLAHPSLKLFITHCGNNGQYEALYHGVPMIGLPLGGEQAYNAQRLTHKGFGLAMDVYNFTADELLANIHKILGDKSYKERVMKASEIFRNQPQSPVERATFWIEHVCRFGGDHLRSSGNDLPLYSYLMLDVVALILITLHFLVYLLYRFLRFLLRKCCGRRTQTDEVTKSKKAN